MEELEGSEELEENIYQEILKFSKKAENLFEKREYKQAIVLYNKALEIVPIPKTKWEASTWLYAGIGDSFFSLNKFKESANAFYESLNCPNGHGNPFLYLRLGQNLFELDDIKGADDNLMRAYMLEGENIFEDDDEKYINHLKKSYDL